MIHPIELVAARALPASVVLFVIIYLSSKYILKRKPPGLAAIYIFIAIWSIATTVQIAKMSQKEPLTATAAEVSPISPSEAQLSPVPYKLTPEEQSQLIVNSAAQAELADAGGTPDPYASLPKEWHDRTPRPYLFGCTENLETSCSSDRTLLTEPVDPNWSAATENRLRAIWNERVPELADDEFLFVMCKTTMCQVNYRFPLETVTLTKSGDSPFGDHFFGAFFDGFKKSTLTSELRPRLRPAWLSFSGPIVSLGARKKASTG